MRDFFGQIQQGLDHDLYYLAVFASLAVPDICGAIGSDDGEATPQNYIAWFDRYVAQAYGGRLSGEDCYRFRCSLVHQGSSQHPRSRYSRVLFVEPTATTNVFHNNLINDALNIDVRIFCRDIVAGAEAWLQEHEGTELYRTNYNRFMRRYPRGFPPYIAGVPVIS